jgi:iron complex transport system substrate-binding protein
MESFSIHGDLKSPARRIVSLAPSITEVLFFLGMRDSVVGVTRQCDFPAEVKDIDNIGSFLKPDSKSILELSPDIIIGMNAMHRHITEMVRNEHIGVILFDYHRVQSVLDVMEAVSSLALNTKKAGRLVASLRRRVDALQRDKNKNEAVRSFFLISESPIMIPSRNSYQYDALRISGAAQVSSGYTQYERITLEEVVHFNPEIIFACGRHRGEPLQKLCPECRSANPICQRIVDDIALKDKWKETIAARTGNIKAIPCHWLCRPGPRLVDGMESIAEILKSYSA